MEKKQTNLMMTSACHLKLKVIAAMSGKTMGEVVWILLNRFDPGRSTEQDMHDLKVLEMIQKDEEKDNIQADKVLAEG